MTIRNLSWLGVLATAICVAGLPLAAQAPGGRGRGGRGAQAAPGGGGGGQFMFETEETDPPPVITHHSITVNGQQLNYTAAVGKIPVPDEAGKTEGHMFYVAYTLDNQDKSHPRPVTFSYNGGPGSDSAYVHMGGFGPRRVLLNDDGSVPPPPYKIVDNQETWLTASDLVFVDAMGTGYSRATSAANLAKAASVSGDAQTFAEFIRMWLYQNNRLNSPIILAGESYGTFRSAEVAGTLLQHHIAPSGVVLLSSVLNLSTLSPSISNDRPYWLALPTLTAIAWEHKKLPPDLQKETIEEVTKQSEDWAQTKYEHYLDMGDTLQGAERKQAVAEMARFTGLPADYVDGYNLRIGTSEFNTELLKSQGLIIGRYDGGQVGETQTPGSPFPAYDPSDLIEVPYLHEFVNYLKNELDYKTTLEYGDRGVGGAGNPGWNYQLGRNWYGTADASSMLASAFEKDPAMRLMLVEGYYDQATPMFEATYSMKHLFISPQEQTHITIQHYMAGHMIYIRTKPRQKLQRDFEAFVKTLPGVASNQ